MSDTKKCSVCGETKPLTEFYLQKPGGKPRAGCKDCLRADTRKRNPAWQKANPEKCRAKVRRWQKRHPEEAREIGRVAMQHWRDGQKNTGQSSFGFLVKAQGRKKSRPANPQ